MLWASVKGSTPIVRLPLTAGDDAVCALFDGLSDSLDSLGLRVATGPAMASRCKAHAAHAGTATSLPFLWMEHVRPLHVVWPHDAKKDKHPQHVLAAGTGALTVPVRNMVLVRRFSAKEQARRMVVAPLLARDFASYPRVALENHLNLITAVDPAGMDDALTWGLAAFLSSSVVDAYFRIVSGNTQVSATELRALPLPSRAVLEAIGRRALAAGPADLLRCDALVDAIVRGQVDSADEGAALVGQPTKRPKLDDVDA